MRRSTTIGTLAVFAVGLMASPSLASTSGMTQKTQTFPVNATGADVSGGMGMASSGVAKGTITVSEGKKSKVCYSIQTTGIDGIQAAHIHRGALGTDGNVVVSLNVKKFNANSMAMNYKPACVTVSKPVAAGILAQPSNYYFNVHTSTYPNGAVRSQL